MRSEFRSMTVKIGWGERKVYKQKKKKSRECWLSWSHVSATGEQRWKGQRGFADLKKFKGQNGVSTCENELTDSVFLRDALDFWVVKQKTRVAGVKIQFLLPRLTDVFPCNLHLNSPGRSSRRAREIEKNISVVTWVATDSQVSDALQRKSRRCYRPGGIFLFLGISLFIPPSLVVLFRPRHCNTDPSQFH